MILRPKPPAGLSAEMVRGAEEMAQFLHETLPDPELRPYAIQLLYDIAAMSSESERAALFSEMNPILKRMGLPLLRWPKPPDFNN